MFISYIFNNFLSRYFLSVFFEMIDIYSNNYHYYFDGDIHKNLLLDLPSINKVFAQSMHSK
jgi:hypothetical protein